jgi:hypothetical protein
MNKMKTTTKIHYTLCGEIEDPNIIYNALSISNACIFKKGEPLAGSKMIFEESGWSIKTEELVVYDVIPEVEKILSIIEPKRQIIKTLIQDYALYSELSIEIFIGKNKEIPAINFDLEIMKRLINLNCEIDFDIY